MSDRIHNLNDFLLLLKCGTISMANNRTILVASRKTKGIDACLLIGYTSKYEH